MGHLWARHTNGEGSLPLKSSCENVERGGGSPSPPLPDSAGPRPYGRTIRLAVPTAPLDCSLRQCDGCHPPQLMLCLTRALFLCLTTENAEVLTLAWATSAMFAHTTQTSTMTRPPSTVASWSSGRGVRLACSRAGRVLRAWKLSSATTGTTDKASTKASTDTNDCLHSSLLFLNEASNKVLAPRHAGPALHWCPLLLSTTATHS